MRIAMNLTVLRPGQMGGTEIYVRNLLAGFSRLQHQHEYRILTASESQGIAPTADGRFSERRVESWLPKPLRKGKHIRHPWQWLATVRELRRFRPDVYHCPLNIPIPPWCVAANTVITLHDIKFVTSPESLQMPDMGFWNWSLRRGLKFVRKIITDSHYSKQAIVDCFQIDPKLVEVVYLGIDQTVFRLEPTLRPAQGKFSLPPAYFFFPAATWPYKNHARLLQALAQLRDRRQLLINLVLTGFPETAHGDVHESLRKHGLESQVTWLGWISVEELVYVYQNARGLIFPSLYEGFGLPIVEAMACGCPVACSRSTSCGEVAGDAALLFDPLDVEELAARMEILWTNGEVRKELIAKGLERAQGFSCERMAERTLAVFGSLQKL
jgi:glycosyltransferase involved in cell wall biosynthesis